MKEKTIETLNSQHIDALKEISNIGAGNAVTALSQFLDCRIEMTVPSIEILPLEEIPDVTGGAEEVVLAILLKVIGDAPGNILFIFSQKGATDFLQDVLKRKVIVEDLQEIEKSALKELGNILAGAYLSALNRITNFNLIQTVPEFAYDMAGAIISSITISTCIENDYALLLETQFTSNGKNIEGYFFLIPSPGSLNKLLSGLGLE
ncbi:MAG: chemotaxis protein CheC [bacterium]